MAEFHGFPPLDEEAWHGLHVIAAEIAILEGSSTWEIIHRNCLGNFPDSTRRRRRLKIFSIGTPSLSI